MKKLMLCLVALAALIATPALRAQATAQPSTATPATAAPAPGDLSGNWQGTLKVGKELRVVFTIYKGDKDGWSAKMYSIDQTPQPIPVTSVTRQGPVIKISVTGIGGSYEGTLSADGKSINGTWTQGPQPFPLTLLRATPETAWEIPEAPKPPTPMAADANPGVEAATIKPGKPESPGKAFTMNGRDVITINTTLNDLITESYGLHARQVIGGQDWMDTDKYDLTIEADVPGAPSYAQSKVMIQKLLADRFALKFHYEKKELSAYVLELGKGEPKLTKSQANDSGHPSLFFSGLGTLPARNSTMEEFAGVMQEAVLDRPVVDHTGIKGRWDFTLKWTPDESQFVGLRPAGSRLPPPGDDAPPDLFTAIQQQLGLKLTAEKTAVDVMVIDHMEKPSPN
jgi:uncharacterized protein (TIGR03435 family)